jgi:activator of 2-hydroxyglutaryl-CoA dehydratase
LSKVAVSRQIGQKLRPFCQVFLLSDLAKAIPSGASNEKLLKASDD